MTDYIMYEINWHWDAKGEDSVFAGCTVSPIYVLDDAYYNPGATLPTIIAKDSSGRKFNGSKANYFDTEQAAYTQIKRDLEETIRYNQSEIALLHANNKAIATYLNSLGE